MQYVSHVLFFPATPPFDVPELRWTSFIGEFVKPIVTATADLAYWFT